MLAAANRHQRNGLRSRSCPFQVPRTRFWIKQTANFLKKSYQGRKTTRHRAAFSGFRWKIVVFPPSVKHWHGTDSTVPRLLSSVRAQKQTPLPVVQGSGSDAVEHIIASPFAPALLVVRLRKAGGRSSKKRVRIPQPSEDRVIQVVGQLNCVGPLSLDECRRLIPSH